LAATIVGNTFVVSADFAVSTFLVAIASVGVLVVHADALETDLAVITVIIALTTEVAVDTTSFVTDLIGQTRRSFTTTVVDGR